VIIQAGDSEDGREFAAQYADGIFTRHGSLEAGVESGER
jgi:alkanesulfonate monooxygenase SsuD/methylene tetrahydromethanopterin reductase-like flavin-dependent oxidoreductase (luciferase family)